MPDIFSNEIRYLKGVGPKRADAFNTLGIGTVGELIEYYPRAYEDRSVIKNINEIIPGEKATVKCTVSNVVSRRIRKSLHILTATLFDGTGYVKAVWFNQDYFYKKLKNGGSFWFFGRFERKVLLELHNPVFSNKFEEFAIIVPLYRKNKELTQYAIRSAMKNALAECADSIREIMPGWLLDEYGLMEYGTAIRNIHYPQDNNLFYKARERLVFQEFLLLQTALLLLKQRHGEETFSGRIYEDFSLGDRYIDNLGFRLTGAQEKVISEIRGDFMKGKPMHRLVQGDVGSGKTAVAAAALADTCGNGCQAALMAPTEILARQHYNNLSKPFAALGLKTIYLGGDLKASEKKAAGDMIAEGKADVIIGTHALIQGSVNFHKLGLVITDEQHRFGVDQRKALAGKGENPHSLVLTATPIPRTLALILYGDLDISVIDEMPPGRKAIETYAVGPDKRRRVLDFARRRMKEGNQVYVVCPRIEEETDDGLMSAEKIHGEMEKFFPDFSVGLVHGRLRSSVKDERMGAFYDGDIDMLVSTTVIEVGVNVSNATLMIIENAERFGLAQLHQLRGRVGRGGDQSYCIMINRGSGEVARKRMEIMSASTDGFYISEQDLVIRGPGEFFGTRQHGIPDFRIANIYTDMDILKKAQEASVKLLDRDPGLRSGYNESIMGEIERLYEGYAL